LANRTKETGAEAHIAEKKENHSTELRNNQ